VGIVYEHIVSDLNHPEDYSTVGRLDVLRTFHEVVLVGIQRKNGAASYVDDVDHERCVLWRHAPDKAKVGGPPFALGMCRLIST
jgi:hypothetical protein